MLQVPSSEDYISCLRCHFCARLLKVFESLFSVYTPLEPNHSHRSWSIDKHSFLSIHHKLTVYLYIIFADKRFSWITLFPWSTCSYFISLYLQESVRSSAHGMTSPALESLVVTVESSQSTFPASPSPPRSYNTLPLQITGRSPIAGIDTLDSLRFYYKVKNSVHFSVSTEYFQIFRLSEAEVSIYSYLAGLSLCWLDVISQGLHYCVPVFMSHFFWQVAWPLELIIDSNAIKKYNQVSNTWSRHPPIS